MTAPTSQPPTLSGLTLERKLGGGGFADVYLYRQEKLKRSVAVKVLRAHAATDATQQQFQAEAMLMAALSDHPNIVTIHDASIADDGRPYLVMAYLSGKNLSDRYKTERIELPDVLAIGVQLAGAVETAHREHILHRDIKPANVLTGANGHPALTDFGISVSTAELTGQQTIAMSIPWSPPEMLSDTPAGDERADVYSLAATLYTLLARRSPYERPGQSNEPVDLIQRILHSALTPTGRPEVSASAERTLARALHKNPVFRPRSALVFGRELQQLQRELGLPVTPIEIAAEDPQATAREIAAQDDGRTKVKPIRTIHAQNVESTALRPIRADSSAAGRSADHTQVRQVQPRPYLQPGYLQPARPAADTELRPEPVSEVEEPVEKRSRVPMLIGGAIVVVIAAVVGIVLWTRGTTPAAAPDGPSTPATTDNAAPPASAPTNLAARADKGNIVFSWTNPSPASGDYFRWQRTDVAPATRWTDADKPTVSVPGTRVCLSVEVVRADGELSAASSLCYPDKG